MKNFINQVGRLRSQQGAVRFVVVCTLLVALTLVVFGMGYSKLITRAHALPVGHFNAAKDCGCRSAKEIADSSNLTGAWTPPAKDYTPQEISRMPSVILLPAGETLPLSISATTPVFAPPLRSGPGTTANFRSGGKWSAIFGKITVDGLYTAPRYVPDQGIDTITYNFPGHPELPGLQLDVRIVANPAIPGSGSTPLLTLSSDNSTGEIKQIFSWEPALPAGVSPPVSNSELEQASIGVTTPGEKLPSPIQVTSGEAAAFHSKGVSATYIMPATNSYGTATAALVAVRTASALPLLQAKELPQLPGDANSSPDPVAMAEHKHCTNGSHKSGKITTGAAQRLGPGRAVTPFTVELSAELELEIIKAFPGLKGKIGVKGTISVSGTYYDWKQTQTRPVYECIKHKWVYQFTSSHSRVGSSTVTDPGWVSYIILQDQKNGHPSNWQSYDDWNPPTPSP